MPSFSRDSKIYVAGHRGLVGSAIVRKLKTLGYQKLLLEPRNKLDLRNQSAVEEWFRENKPEYVFVAAGTVGGIQQNSTYPADFIYDNLMIHSTIVHSSHLFSVRKLLYLGSPCIYPRDCPQPMKESHLFSGKLEPTNEPYAVAKIAGITLCTSYRRQYGNNFITAIPTNLYGPYDNFDPNSSHVIPALIRKFHEAKKQNKPEVTLWGTGSPTREFLHVDDLADCCMFLMQNYEEDSCINVGSGEDISIQSLAEKLRNIIYPGCRVAFDTSKPDGMPKKCLDNSRVHKFGWKHRMTLEEGLHKTYEWFKQNCQ